MSNIVPYRIQLDIKEVFSQLSLSVALGDTGRKLIVQLVDDGKEFELGRGTYAVFTALKPDGNTLYNDCTIQDNQIIYNFTEQTTSCEGITDCQIVLYDATGYLVTAPRFAVIVYDAIRSRVDIQSASENLAIDEIAEREAYRQLQEAKRQDNEASRVLNEEARGISEAYRIASINVLRSYLSDTDLPILNNPIDILNQIDSNLADAKNNNFFRIAEGETKSIAIIGNTMTAGDADANGLTELETNKVYWYRGVRFVCLSVEAPEISVLAEIVDKASKAEAEARKSALYAEQANAIATQKPTVYFESNFANLVQAYLYNVLGKAGDIIVLLEETQPDFIVLDSNVPVSGLINISRSDILNGNIPQPKSGKIYKIEGVDNPLIAIESGIQTPATDSALNANSTNPVQNKVITKALNDANTRIDNLDTIVSEHKAIADRHFEDYETKVNNLESDVYNRLNTFEGLVDEKKQEAINEANAYTVGELRYFSEAYDKIINSAVITQEYFYDNTVLDVQHNKDYHGSQDITELLIRISSAVDICSVTFKIVDSGDFNIELMGVNGYIGKAPDFKNGETWELNIHNGIIASGKVVSE